MRRGGTATSLVWHDAEPADRIALFGERRGRVDPGRRRVCVPVQVLDVGKVGPRVAKPRRERVANVIHGERFETRFPGRRADRLVRARRSKQALAGIIFGLGMALGAANFIAWMF